MDPCVFGYRCSFIFCFSFFLGSVEPNLLGCRYLRPKHAIPNIKRAQSPFFFLLLFNVTLFPSTGKEHSSSELFSNIRKRTIVKRYLVRWQLSYKYQPHKKFQHFVTCNLFTQYHMYSCFLFKMIFEIRGSKLLHWVVNESQYDIFSLISPYTIITTNSLTYIMVISN